jgi:D-beta-D-heptose 7-phosphate kinase / D-beta-D-heptose 1-phosphate adenosyltransferase
MLIDDIKGRRVLVIGDVMLDHFVGGQVDRVSPEAPALVLQVEDQRSMLGGAGNVAANIARLGGVAVLVGVVGDDPAAAHLADLASAFGDSITDAVVRSAACRTTEKTRYIAGDRHLLRADSETVGLAPDMEGALRSAIRANVNGCSAVVVSDYAKGVVSPAVMSEAVSSSNRQDVPLVADPKRRDFALYTGADVLTPNRKELEFATGLPCGDLAGCERAARQVIEVTGAAVLVTRSEDGVALFQAGEPAWSDGPQTKVVRDVSGAGDTILAGCAVALAAGASLVDASHLANVAAAVAVGKSGTSPVTPDELNLALLHAPDADALSGKLVSTNSASSIRRSWSSQGLEVGFTNGCFDLLHPGHVQLLAEAATKCDRLIVALNTDDSVRRLKGVGRPVQTELARAEVIGALRAVDLVVLFDQDSPRELIAELRPDVLMKGADYSVDTVVGADLVIAQGGRVELIDLVPGESSSRLIAMSKGGDDLPS